MKGFEEKLTGGHPNSLGNTLEVVDEVLADNTLFDELFHCYFSTDDVVHLRTSNAMKRIGKENKALLVHYIDRFLTDIASIDQASTQWTLAQLFDLLNKELTPEQKAQATVIMKRNVAEHTDWIVLAQTMDTLAKWAKKDPDLKEWLLPQLERHTGDSRKSVASKATKMIQQLNK